MPSDGPHLYTSEAQRAKNILLSVPSSDHCQANSRSTVSKNS